MFSKDKRTSLFICSVSEDLKKENDENDCKIFYKGLNIEVWVKRFWISQIIWMKIQD